MTADELAAVVSGAMGRAVAPLRTALARVEGRLDAATGTDQTRNAELAGLRDRLVTLETESRRINDRLLELEAHRAAVSREP